ncbi:unnamed protein product [Durusdinium trenchii]|uniref:Uncharacterized protein n=2 Tax=Durusdinium trenchii TaxID=1381693 RepID=A0ABP0NCJ8_9DINO
MGCASSAALPREPPQVAPPSPPYIPTDQNPQSAQSAGPQPSAREGGALKTAPLVRSLVSLRRDTCSVVQEDSGQWFLKFEFGSLATGTATASFLATVEEAEHPASVPTPSASSTASLRFAAERRQSGRLFLSADLPESLRSFDTQGGHHVVLDLQADSEDPSAVTRQRSFLRLSPEGGEVHVEKQLVQCGNIIRPLDALYGTLPNPRSSKAAEKADEGGDCVICLSNPREVAILHCRHVCLCTSCAKVTSSTWSFQCPVCRGRVAAMVGLRDDSIQPQPPHAL